MSKLKKVSISLALLSCFAITSNVLTMYQYGDAEENVINPELELMIALTGSFYDKLSADEKLKFDQELAKEIHKEQLKFEQLEIEKLEKERKEKAEIEKINMGQILLSPKQARFSDVRIHYLTREKD